LHGDAIVMGGKVSGLGFKPPGMALSIAKMVSEFFDVVGSALYGFTTGITLCYNPISWVRLQPSALAHLATKSMFGISNLRLCSFDVLTALCAWHLDSIFGWHKVTSCWLWDALAEGAPVATGGWLKHIKLLASRQCRCALSTPIIAQASW